MKRCLSFKIKGPLERCKNQIDKGFFCRVHKREPYKYAVYAFSFIAGVASIVGTVAYFSSESANYSSIYKRGLASFTSKNWVKAADLFDDLYELVPDYPNLAYHYGKALYHLQEYKKAYEVWLNVPVNEKHENFDYNIGYALMCGGDFANASSFFEKSVGNLTPDDPKYWDIKVRLLLIKCVNCPIEEYYNKVYDLCNYVDHEITTRTRSDIFSVYDTNKLIIRGDLYVKQLNLESSAFLLLLDLFHKLYNNNMFQKAYNVALKAANYLKGPSTVGVACRIKQQRYIEYLSDLSSIVRVLYFNQSSNHSNKEISNHPEVLKLIPILKDIEKQNSNNYPKIADIAMVMRKLYGDIKSSSIVRKGGFKLRYECTWKDKEGISKVYAVSTFLDVQEVTDTGNSKTYTYKKEIPITKGFLLPSKPSFKLIAVDNLGARSIINMFPYIIVD